MTRAVVDTNIVVSAFLWGGNPRAALDAARQKTSTLFTSAALIAELEDVLSRAKFATRIATVGSSVDEMLGDYLALAQLVRPTEHPAVVRDPDDDHVIACALAAEAEIIVSSDDDLLTLGHYRDIDILSVTQMLRRLSTT
jgi:putative PIN family toxin of toxin-antitoxin system